MGEVVVRKKVSPFAAVYLVILAILIALTIVYTVVALCSRQWTGAVYALAILALVVVAYWTEGSEMSAASLQDKEPEQVDPALQPAMQRLRDNAEEIFSGQQFLAVAAVVLLTNCCGQLARLPIASSPGWLGWIGIYLPRVTPIYESLFPILVVFWIAELLPRFIARDRPIDVFSSLPSLGIMWFSERLGTVLDLAAPSNLLRDWLVKKENATSLRPNRRSMYEMIATFRDGIGVETAIITLTIGADGSMVEESWCEIKAYRGGICKVIEHQDLCDTPFDSEFKDDPKKTTYRGRIRTEKKASVSPEGMNQVDLSIRFPEAPLGLHEVVAYTVTSTAGAGAYKCGDAVAENYEYTIEKIPMKQLIVIVKVGDGSPFYIGDVGAEVRASYQSEINDDEVRRIKREQLGTGGKSWQFTVDDPLPPLATYKFTWMFYDAT